MRLTSIKCERGSIHYVEVRACEIRWFASRRGQSYCDHLPISRLAPNLRPLPGEGPLPPNGFTGTVHRMDLRVGGAFRILFQHFSRGAVHVFGGEYVGLVQHSKIRHTNRSDDPNLPGVVNVRIELKPESCDTEASSIQPAVPKLIPLELCDPERPESLGSLARRVTAE